MNRPIKRLVAAGALVAAAVLAAPGASANPDITDPYCTGGQEPLFGQCKALPDETGLQTSGLDPQVESGLNPEEAPAI